ncbi:penicilin amidase [Halovivax ruber XH-70]|uniref:Penicilin amidase n=1 Tax=Halovivax ruber (strain DSM 18193 / JCM 13892 / XH-70) TaxID=797302 RepID=L0IDM5_HALRX|nr:penicillin acylase family protein [Halovivax ruber]AGB16933.1 penicilin amidase [Halovivax ruber XH-70]
MSENTTRRALLATVLGAGTVGLAASDVGSLLEKFAPLSGDTWDGVDRDVSGEATNPYGSATIKRDDVGIPHVEAEDERAAYFAVGYVQGFDRLFQLDIQRRQMRGQLSEIAGEATVESDEFHVKMDFVGAAEATWDSLAETSHAPLVRAFADGVNAAIENEELPIEFQILGHEPAPWTPVDTILLEKQIAWTLTGNFDALRRERLTDALGAEIVTDLYPTTYDHDVPVLRPGDDALGDVGGVDGNTARPSEPASRRLRTGSAAQPNADQTSGTGPSGGDSSTSEPGQSDGTGSTSETNFSTSDEPASGSDELVDWLAQFESPPGVGSNSWVVSGEYTDSGTPIVANDPHLSLMTPPIWYEQHVVTSETNVRGVTFPGVPFVIIGANEDGAWGFTNVGADVLDCYRYELDEDGSRYRYQGEWREFDTEEHEIAVADGEDRTVTVRKTVHGPFLEREGEHVGVAWTGLTATRTSQSIYEIGRSEGFDDVLDSLEKFDEPTQNFVYADADGRTCYYTTGQLPRRTIDGDPVRGDRVFDGSAGEAEWAGYEPYGEATWEGFVPFDEKPHAIDPDRLATANQRVADDPTHYVGTAYAAPYRGGRIYDRLDELTADGTTTLDDHAAVQTDRVDPRAAQLVPELVAAVDRVAQEGDRRIVEASDLLADWDHEMVPDSEAALVFARWMDNLVETVCEPRFEDAGLDDSDYPSDWAVATLPADSPLFESMSRTATLIGALEATLSELDGAEWETYGDYNTTAAIEHPFGGQAAFLNYDEHPIGGSRATINNYRVDSAVGSSTRLLAHPGGEARTILPGGNSGDYSSDHYDDQFEEWIAGEYRPLTLEPVGETKVTFEGDSR